MTKNMKIFKTIDKWALVGKEKKDDFIHIFDSRLEARKKMAIAREITSNDYDFKKYYTIKKAKLIVYK